MTGKRLSVKSIAHITLGINCLIIIIISDILVSERTIGNPYLGIVHYRLDLSHERLFRQAPCSRNRREEAPSMPFQEPS